MFEFIAKIKARLNIRIALNALLVGVALAAIISIIWGIYYVSRGYMVEKIIYPIGGGIATLTSIVYWCLKKKNTHESAVFADKHFSLKDSLTSALEFEAAHKEGHIYELQRKQAESAVASLSPKNIPLSISKRLLSTSLIGLIAAGSLAFIPASDRVIEEQRQRAESQRRSAEIQKHLEKEIDKMINELSEDEKAAIDPSALRQWVKELKETDDKREAMRNLARVEQKIQKSIDKLNNRKNEELLKKAGLKLEKSDDETTKNIGKKLKNKEFKAAASELEKYKFKKNNSEELKKKLDQAKLDKIRQQQNDPEKKKALDEKQKKLDKLRELTKRLAEALREQRGNNGNKADERMMDERMMDNQLPDDLLEQLLEQMDNEALDMDELLKQMELQEQQGQQLTDEELEQLRKMMENMDQNLEEFQKMLRKMEAMRKMRQRLQGLKRQFGMAQKFANGQSMQLGLAKVKGGKKAGIGSDQSRRKAKDKLENNKQYSKLKGLKGAGPTQSSIEEATSGSGSSNRKGAAKKRTFDHQMSSFINREDVPEEMKQAVKQYFEDIHKTK